ncbi:hypothetical protein TcasGA2_TC033278 [Tribolium castaneum]|uniref:Uncharacterized protein n=1 Tax=Tribolium castaneum TaxID=7070 RepID=A0A139WHQ5_TRICA|nr:hypothetical protein TcasGA2_TC033278 [Tribolium castaneum]
MPAPILTTNCEIPGAYLKMPSYLAVAVNLAPRVVCIKRLSTSPPCAGSEANDSPHHRPSIAFGPPIWGHPRGWWRPKRGIFDKSPLFSPRKRKSAFPRLSEPCRGQATVTATLTNLNVT